MIMMILHRMLGCYWLLFNIMFMLRLGVLGYTYLNFEY
jgi:hypothetical protein